MLKIQWFAGHYVLKQEETGENKVTLISEGFIPGDFLIFYSDLPYAWVKLADEVTESLVYFHQKEHRFILPLDYQTRKGFAPGLFERKQEIKMWEPTPEEVNAYYNLALNPSDQHLPWEMTNPAGAKYGNPIHSMAVEVDAIAAYPHAFANRVTRNEGEFFARNAIDGMSVPGGHGPYPYQSWGGAVHNDLSYVVYFGREVTVDKVVLHLRSDYKVDSEGKEHDTYWHTALLAFSDGSELEVKLEKSEKGQEITFSEKTVIWVMLKRLDPFRNPNSQMFAALNQMEVWGRNGAV
ncbi:MAG: hypothetical protein E7399_02350 [Ruminococcaceae bacterium]|nr:hypothetical protein [Oscillospiraceae bacterium]